MRDKSIRHGHISTLHLWWARRPLQVCRAVVFASLFPDTLDEHCPALEQEIINRITTRTRNFNLFNVLMAPSDDLPEQTRLTLVIAHPSLVVNADEVNGKLKPYIEKIASKRGNSERIYRNTILFLVPTEIGMNQLQIDLRELMACNKIRSDYMGQLSQEQKKDIQDKNS